MGRSRRFTLDSASARNCPNCSPAVTNSTRPGQAPPVDRQSLRWHVLLSDVVAANVMAICERLALTNALCRSVTATGKLLELRSALAEPAMRPSHVARILDDFPDSALQVGWLLSAKNQLTQQRIATYAANWRQARPAITGMTLWRWVSSRDRATARFLIDCASPGSTARLVRKKRDRAGAGSPQSGRLRRRDRQSKV